MSGVRKRTTKFSLAYRDPRLVDLLKSADQQTLARWARDCAKRVLPLFEKVHPDDPRPRQALQALQAWIDTGVFRMADIRRASLGSHAAAREAGDDNPARSAARAAGQAVATAHVKTHAIGAANYAAQAIHRRADPLQAEALVAKEREWQYRRLLRLTRP
jgi:hypothetical protein